METNNNLQWMIGGEAGFGIKVTGQMFARMCTRGGLQIFDYTEYPSLIRGGHNAYQVVVGESTVHSQIHGVHLLVALNQETIDRHHAKIVHGGGLVYDSEDPQISVKDVGKHVRLLGLPLGKIAKEQGHSLLFRNVAALGASVGILHYDMHLLGSVIHTAFDRKGDALVDANLAVAKAAYDFARTVFKDEFPFRLTPHADAPHRLVITGHTAVAMGAIAAGCKFFAGYPMTPTTSVMTYLAKHAQKTGMIVRHAEDEIGAINSAIGASYAGVRSMVATAGGGYSLMVEATGLAGMLEVPLVIVEGQRPGPSTGLPTWTGQADLQFVLHAAQDEFPRIILAPGDVEEAFYLTHQAFNLADTYQTPVFVLTDKFLGESHQSIDDLRTDHLLIDRGAVEHVPEASSNGLFARYADVPSGISPRTFPGTPNGTHTANSDEHDAFGAVSEEADNRVVMMEKRLRKLETARAATPLPTVYGPQNAKCSIICWGSTKGPALAAMEMLQSQGKSVNVIHFVYLHPLPIQPLKKLLAKCKHALLVEGNATGQFGMQLKLDAQFVPESTLFKYDGRPFFPEEIIHAVKKAL